MTSTVDDFPESEVNFGSETDFGINAWIVRPCERYRYQYNDCKSFKARVHQYFIFGQNVECSQWQQDFDNCLKFRKSQKPEDLQKVIESELKRREERLESSVANDVWSYRSEPPKDWLKPLPDCDSNKRLEELKLNIVFKQSLNNNFIRVLYLVCDDSSANLFQNGCFQSPESEDNTIGSALKRIALNVLLSQCFFAQTLPNYKTFELELNENNCPKIYVFKLNDSIDNIWSLSSHELWKSVAKQIMNSILAENHCKYLAFCSFTRYHPNSNPNKSLMFSDILHNVKGYLSLGGGGLALMGTACLYTWPSDISELTNRFNDLRAVDRNNLMDDSYNRGSLGGCYATTLGALVHELAHILDLGHSDQGIMNLDFHFINQFFTTKCDPKPIKWWNCSQICILSNHKWIKCYKSSKNDNLFEIQKNQIKSRFGIIAIEYRDPNDNRTLNSRVFTLGAKCIQLKPKLGTVLFAIDSNGNTIKHNLN